MAQQQWTLQPSTTATTLVGVGAGSDTAIAAAAWMAQAQLQKFMQTASGPISKVGGGLLLDAAKSNDGTLSVVTSLLPVFVQDTTVSSDFVQAVGCALGKKSINGVAVSTDRGKTFSASPVPSGFTRYGSFIDSQTWVVSAGIWGDDANSTAAHEVNYNHQDVSLSARLRAGKGGKIQRVGGDEPPVNCSTNGWLASISITTNGGLSYQEAFRSPQGSQYYFNGVSCSGSTCVAVAEGDTAGGGTTGLAFTSSDLGKTWTQTFYIHARGMTGQFYYTEDGGQTWVLRQTMDNCMPLDLSFSQSGLGVASCVSSSGSTAQAALYA